METARKHDLNGWYEISANPISKAGVFEYLGSSINAPEPDRIYRVYRPESELSRPETIESFRLLPWVIEHEMLGTGETPAEKKGIEGVIGEDVFYDDGYLRGNIKVFSDRLAELIETGTKELSLGYKCVYDFTPGSFDGESYDVVQRKIRGNHLATVEEGRMGPEVAVLDHSVVTFDSEDFVMSEKTLSQKDKKNPSELKEQNTQDQMPDEAEDQGEVDEGGEMTLKEMSMVIKKIMPLLEDVEKLKDMMNGETGEAMEEGEEMSEKPAAMQGDEEYYKNEEEKTGMDAIKSELATVKKELAMIKSNGMDSKQIMESISTRDKLADKLSRHIGNFDCSNMTAADVAKYGVKKLSIPANDGQEMAAVNAYMHNRRPEKMITHGTSYGQDSAEDFITNLFEGE